MTPPGKDSAVPWEIVVGLEVHTQLLTRTKLFCRCENLFGAPPNTLTCPVCLGHPGVLPVLNAEAVRLGLRAGLAAGCSVSHTSTFERKHYFYPDLPKGYQISQYARPLLTGGSIAVRAPIGEKTIRIHRMHLEEDAGKNLHAGIPDRSHVDLNRAGVPLLEIVSEPDIRSADEAVDYLKRLRQILRAVRASDGNMEEGSFRCDINISVRKTGSTAFGTKVEVKNVNSFRFVHRAILHETERQIALVEEGGRVLQETRLFDPSSGRTKAMRSKEEALDYRYFPEPDLPPLVIDPSLIEEQRMSLPELPAERVIRYNSVYGLDLPDAETIVAEEVLCEFFEEGLEILRGKAVAGGVEIGKARDRWVSFILSEVLRELNRRGQAVLAGHTSAHQTAGLMEEVLYGRISFSLAKETYARAVEEGKSPLEVIGEQGYSQLSGGKELSGLVDAVLSENPGEVAGYRSGKDRLFGFLVGQVMKKSGGKANPEKVNEILREKLKG